MEPVKITDNKEWNSIDIFLFSNGQQYSPPRKYHLRSEELDCWGATINYLGRTHYGSGHSSIELYSIDGRKINGPLELNNGAAYVAVETSDSFINTGYEEYLLKASRQIFPPSYVWEHMHFCECHQSYLSNRYRSWEKRLAQKSHNIETSNPDLKRDMDPAVQTKTDEVKVPKNISDTPSLKGDNNTKTSPQRTRPTKPYQNPQRKSFTSSKQIQKKKSFDANGVMLKKTCAETDKVFPCPKKTSLKKKECTNRKPSTIVNRKPNETTVPELPSWCKKRSSIKAESSPKSEASKNRITYDTAPIREPQIIDLYDNKESELMSLNVLDRTIDNSIHHNEQHNLIEDNNPVLDERTCIIQTNSSQNFQKLSSNKSKQINVHEQTDTISKENVPSFNINKNNQLNDTYFNESPEKQIIDEYVAHMNKGGLLLLKLKVKLKDCKSIFNRDKINVIPTVASLPNLTKNEKTSQVDINISFSGELLKSNDHQCAHDKSLQSLLGKFHIEESDINSKNPDPRIIILECACDYSDNHKCCMCDTLQECEEDRNNDGMLNHKLNKTFTRCECQDETLRTSKDEYSLKNGDILQPINDTNKGRSSLPTANSTRVKDLAQKFEMSDRIKPNNNNKENFNDTSTHENGSQSVVLTRLNGAVEIDKGIGNPVDEESNVPISKTNCSASTQTDWSNVMLEARLQEGNNYTFHLPSLHTLKQYNL